MSFPRFSTLLTTITPSQGGHAQNLRPALGNSNRASEPARLWFPRDNHHRAGRSLLVSTESGRRSPLRPGGSQSDRSPHARDQQPYVDRSENAEPELGSGNRDAGGKACAA